MMFGRYTGSFLAFGKFDIVTVNVKITFVNGILQINWLNIQCLVNFEETGRGTIL